MFFKKKISKKIEFLKIDSINPKTIQMAIDFVKNQPIIAKGRGELFEPIDLSLAGKYIALINPGLHIGTKEAYAGVNVMPHPHPGEMWGV